MKKTAVTMNFFPEGDDLPLFSGAPVAAAVRPFVPAVVARQESLLDLRLDPFHTLEALQEVQEAAPCKTHPATSCPS